MDDHNIEGSSGTSGLSNVPVPSSNLTVNYETKLLEALFNEGKHERVLNQRRPTFNYDEKTLREAAAAEVAQTNNRNGVFIGYGDESVGIDIGVGISVGIGIGIGIIGWYHWYWHWQYWRRDL